MLACLLLSFRSPPYCLALFIYLLFIFFSGFKQSLFYYVFLLDQVSSGQFFDSTCLLLGNQLVADLSLHVWHIGLNAWAQQLFHMVRASPNVCFDRVVGLLVLRASMILLAKLFVP